MPRAVPPGFHKSSPPPLSSERVARAPMRKGGGDGRAGRASPSSAWGWAVPSESALLWGVICDVLWAPLWFLGLFFGRSRVEQGLRPLARIATFVSAARMTATLIVLNGVVFTAEIVARQGGLSDAQILDQFALRPGDFARGHFAPLLLHVFAHASASHLLGNMLALFVFGRVVERHLGPWRVLSAYAVAALCSTTVSLAVQVLWPAATGPLPTLGASGAIAGLVALAVLLQPLTITFEALVPLPLFVVGWLAMAADLVALWRAASPLPHGVGRLAQTLSTSAIDHPAHLGGYLSACLFYWMLDRKGRQRARTGLAINILSAALAATVWNVFLRRG